MGDMLYMAAGGKITRVHGPFSSDADVENVVNHLKAQAEPSYLEEITTGGGDFTGEGLDGMYGDAEEKVDELYDQAVALVTRERKASTSFVQRYLQIGYNRAARIVEEMERQGVIGPANHVGKREILAGDMSEAG
jgi:S-DNA-T family DNA segregation ATPase FtsK/SpoIIIE